MVVGLTDEAAAAGVFGSSTEFAKSPEPVVLIFVRHVLEEQFDNF